MPRSTYYQSFHKVKSSYEIENEAILARIKIIHAESKGRYGAPKIHHILTEEEGFSVSLNRVQRIMKEYNLQDTEALEEALANQGMTVRDLRDQIRDQLMGRFLVSDFVSARITILTPEIEKYYKDHTSDFTTPDEAALSEIIIQADVDSAAESQANEIYRRLQEGEPFSAMASQYSKGPTANKGGSIGTFIVSDLRADMLAAIKDLKEGDISKPQKTEEGYVIYHIDTRNYASLKPMDEVKEEIKELLYQERFNPEFDRFIAQLKEDAYIQIYSEAE